VNALIAELGQERPAIQLAVAARKPSYRPPFAARARKAKPTQPAPEQCATRASKPYQESDDELVGRIRAGDPGAFSQLVERYQRRVQQLALSFVRNEHDAQEVVQDAFLRVHLGLGGFRGTSSFYTWLYRIVVNLAIDAKRRPYRRRIGWESIAECADDSRSFELPRISNSDPHEVMSRLELDQRLTLALTQLAPYHRAVIVMREVDGMSYQEMAENLHISKGTVMSRLFHARRRLQHTLASEIFEH
jgi:RNA polymerase sigma-70 factor (ECF subfamily)